MSRFVISLSVDGRDVSDDEIKRLTEDIKNLAVGSGLQPKVCRAIEVQHNGATRQVERIVGR